MLIILAGLIGSGKTTIAKELSNKLNIPYYSIDDDKERICQQFPKYNYFLQNNIPFPDEMRKKTFQTSVTNLKKLHQKHKNIIVEETFHKKDLRNFFFQEAKKIFGTILITHIKSNETTTKQRLEQREKKETHMVGYEMYQAFKKQWQPLEKVDYEFINERDFEKNMNSYVEFIQQKLISEL